MAFRAHVQHDPSGGACRAKTSFEGGRQPEIRSVFFDTDIDLPPNSTLQQMPPVHRPSLHAGGGATVLGTRQIQKMIWEAVASYSH